MPKMGIAVSEGTISSGASAGRLGRGDERSPMSPPTRWNGDAVAGERPPGAHRRRGRRTVDGRRHRSPRSTAAQGPARPTRRRSRRPTAPGRSAKESADRSGLISPVVRRIADKHGVDLGPVEGTGIGGRIRKKDVLAYVRRATAGASASRRSTPSRRTGPTSPIRTRAERERPVRWRAPRAHDAHAPCDRGAHGGQPPDGGPLHDDRRGRHVEGRARGALKLKPVFAQRGVPLTYLAFVARATIERARATTRC